MVDRRARLLLAVEDTQRTEESLLAESVQLPVEISERVVRIPLSLPYGHVRSPSASREVVAREGANIRVDAASS